MELNDLERFERRVFSQNGEDGVLEAIFAAVGVTNRYCVEFGCGDGTECNTAYLREQGWQGLLMDPAAVSRNPKATVRHEFVTAGNIDSLLRKYEVPEEFDLLSIDIDGNDYWVWQAITHRPRVVVIEYNGFIPSDERKTIAYDPAFQWTGTDYFGASLRALAELAERKGFTLIHCDSRGINAFFVETRILPPEFVPRPLEAIYRAAQFDRYPADPRSMVEP